jgi:hypothetical protein
MRPELNKKYIRKAKYKYAWYKSFIKSQRNFKVTDYKNEQSIHVS